ncbi:hypothetical protein GCM10010401_16780 [Rarobacter faecitabidus]|uniref:ABC-type phosphate transport system substrate-binding protein n=1 Tax=Rarobacter faecitabidus TaxID=13243 RepID=A0A542ZXI3_RARFA|nr:Ig-like domain repeat protein [Rarobacter faecitabidus]TQL64920.1 ABC-type phosphate transport system substrate-binding protein [Rarobacter faecitabidus]
MIAKKTAHVAAGIGAGALLFAAAALPVHADPAGGAFGTLVGLGSDTTQDVLNGIASAIPGNLVASYDATGSGTVVTRAGGTAIPRANGSGAGVNLLRVAIGQTGSASVSTFSSGTVSVETAAVAGQIDFARSSSGAGSNVVAGGVLTYVPFAVDAVTYAVSPTSVLPKDLTKDQLISIYKGAIDRVAYKTGEASQLLDKTDSVPAGYTSVGITTYIPQAGSGTRSYWLGQVDISEAQISNNTFPNLKATDLGGAPVQEHKGAALVTGNAEQQKATIVPFSIAQWISQANGKVTDHRANAQLGGVTVAGTLQTPTIGSGTSYALNPNFKAYNRTVYNIVPSKYADDPNSVIRATFVGSNSAVCQQTAVIQSFGFGTTTDCGDTTIRAYAPSEATIAATIPASAQVGKASTLSAKVTSFGNGGGTLTFKNGSTVLASTTIAKGQDTASAQWTPAASGGMDITTEFVPNLAGVGAAVSPASPITVSAASVPAPAATSIALTVSKAPTAGKTVTVTASITKPSVAGTVTFFDGAKALGNPVTVAASAKTASTTFKASKLSYSIRAVFTPATSAAIASNAATTVKVAKAKAAVKVGKVKAGKRSATVAVTVKVSGVKAAGKITAKVGKKKVGTGTVKNGKATLKLKKLKAGKNKVTFTYGGAVLVAKASSSKSITAKK